MDGRRTRGDRGRARRDLGIEAPERAEQSEPALPDDITGRELDRSVRQQLRSLPERLATEVARHLVAAGRLLDDDPDAAYQHTVAARTRAGRLAVVREACGEAAYLAGHYAAALTELRTARRMNGSVEYLPVIADCERAVGHPERALALAKEAAVGRLDPAGRAEMTIVAAGARRDLGQAEMAVRLLHDSELTTRERAPWVARLRYAYADALLAVGRAAEALEWFHRAAAVDGAAATDAADRVAALEGLRVIDAEHDAEGAAPTDPP